MAVIYTDVEVTEVKTTVEVGTTGTMILENKINKEINYSNGVDGFRILKAHDDVLLDHNVDVWVTSGTTVLCVLKED